MKKRSLGLIFVIMLLFLLLALELKYIEDSLTVAITDDEDMCNDLCLEEGKVGFLKNGYCNCRVPVTFSKRWTCFWNVSAEKEKVISSGDNSTFPRRRIPIYPSDIFKDKISPRIARNYAVSAVSGYPDSDDMATKIFGIYEHVSKRVSYVSDPVGEEYVASPNETIETGGGDCDDYTVLLASMYKAVGINPTLVQVHNEEYGHVFLILPVGETLEMFLDKYKDILEKYSDYHGDLAFHFIIFGTSKEHCEAINRNLADGGDINSFNIVIDGTTRDYPGSMNPSNGFGFIKFVPL